MDAHPTLWMTAAAAPAVLMAAAVALPLWRGAPDSRLWQAFQVLSGLALASAAAALLARWAVPAAEPAAWAGLMASTTSAWMALLVQLLGTVIGAFSARYLQGEPGQRRYLAAYAAVLAAVQLLLLADHWLVLIGAWALVGSALQRLLCFYADRPFALLAAHKKRLADRLADGLLLVAAGLAWAEVGSGSLSALWAYVAQHGATPLLQASAVLLALAVILRTALLPVHGWLIQVMEAPTPVSALLHAGVVNLGGFVLIRFAPLLDAAPAARWLLIAFGLGTAVLAGLVMLTRVSIKLRLAWSTVAQMGFMVLECGLGLYTLAALHLIGHSLYKAHAFLASGSTVQQARRQALHSGAPVAAASLCTAPLLALALVLALQTATGSAPWPWWWSGALALAWAPLLWLPAGNWAAQWPRGLAGLALVAGFSAAALLAHALPLGVADAPFAAGGLLALAGLAALYLALALLQWQPRRLAGARRWAYAGFYIDEFVTRLTLRLWPAPWAPAQPARPQPALATD